MSAKSLPAHAPAGQEHTRPDGIYKGNTTVAAMIVNRA
jgi:hypothetical protein